MASGRHRGNYVAAQQKVCAAFLPTGKDFTPECGGVKFSSATNARFGNTLVPGPVRTVDRGRFVTKLTSATCFEARRGPVNHWHRGLGAIRAETGSGADLGLTRF
jgi:hypothetical protein